MESINYLTNVKKEEEKKNQIFVFVATYVERGIVCISSQRNRYLFDYISIRNTTSSSKIHVSL